MQTAIANPLGRMLRSGGFAGGTIEPGDRGYDSARRVWNGAIDRRPALVVRPDDTADVAAAISFARQRALTLAVRGGGHSVAGHSTCDDGLVVDLSAIRHVEVDARARRARVGGGALLGDLDRATQRHGLAVPAGQVSHTGVGGLTLGGGIGYLTRSLGLTIDSLEAAKVVTAAGDVVRADADHNADLFWGLRGGGGNFGVVTEFEFRLHPVGPLVTAGVFAYSFERAREVLRASREVMDDAPDELSVHEILITVPRHDPFPRELQGRPAVFLVPVHVGSEETARADLAPFRELAPAFDLVGPMPYVALQSMIDHDNRAGLGHYSRSHWLAGYEDELIDILVDGFGTARSPMSHVITARMGGAITRVGAQETAFRHRDAHGLLWILGYWPDPDGDPAPHRDWVDGLFDGAAPFSSGGTYVNGLEDEGPARVRAAYGGDTFARLAALKRCWDPDNVFRVNQNIPPSAA
jgi:FAD/FMN-containing dehydrogenase